MSKPVLDELEDILWLLAKDTWGQPNSDARKKRLKTAYPEAAQAIQQMLAEAERRGRIKELRRTVKSENCNAMLHGELLDRQFKLEALSQQEVENDKQAL